MEINLVPDEISCQEQVFDLKFHPHADIVAAGLINGRVNVYRYSANGPSDMVLELSHHQSSCRGIEFDSEGQRLFSVSSDRSWSCVDTTGNVIAFYENAHQVPINKCLLLDNNCLTTGDDSGCVKIWDVRTNSEVSTFHVQEDYISGFSFNSDASTLLCTSGDATLCAYDIRKRLTKTSSSTTTSNAVKQSDAQESEIHSVEILKHGRKVICGTQDGVILIFSWGRWGDCSDRFPGHPQTVDCMLKVDESTVITGSSDGLLRVVSIHPNKILGVIGDHDDFPVEGMCASRDRKILGTFSHDDVIRFWDISMFDGDVDETDMGEECTEKMPADEEEWEDADEEEMSQGNSGCDKDDSDDSDDDSSEDGVESKKMPAFKFQSKNERFYADL
mmetsp:Transcript_22499/g.32854  ORF Transcript_22499/g.32854 Transcript_22499/m.32854 type:complete len:389 (-) Transcript_22499:160-1326(-)|eukprot:CAMPEP_0185029202 /NCGR_PEP_ID=MMETSP1103-20130426/15366_1 /TAXON_ID=36769 /ORGANISM="Paraphysomonas bandaiensis, Strain Caron Lab Isolate" /LENGTH=388 /DNA_ID=CAMNT_0027563861 /DNA_START=58 /DNA_END=1224 /DNA_ORIENTATION=+